MRVPTRGKRLVALGAAAALSVSGIVIAGPANAAPENAKEPATASAQPKDKVKSVTFQAAAQQAFDNKKVAAVGFGKDGQVIVQTVKTKLDSKDTKEFAKLRQYVNTQTDIKVPDDKKIEVQEIAKPYKAMEKNAKWSGKSASGEGTFPATAFNNSVVAGAGYGSFPKNPAPGDTGGVCSIGFPATDKQGNDVLISAGHCGAGAEGNVISLEKPSTAPANGGKLDHFDPLDGKQFGTWKHVQYGGKDNGEGSQTPADAQDFSVIAVDKNAGYNYTGKVATWSKKSADDDNLASDTTDITGVHDVKSDDIGKSVFHSGRTTGKTDGKIQDFGTSVVDGYAKIIDNDNKPHYVYGFGSTTSVDHGDSGGAVMMGDQAVGVVSGGTPATDDKPGQLWTAELFEGLKHLDGVKIKTAGAEPTETATPTPTKTTATPTPTKTTATPTPTKTTTSAPTVDVKVNPSSALPGEKVTVSGLKSLAGKKVDVVFHSTPKTAANDVTVGKDGTVTTTVPNLPAGKHSVAVTSADGKTTYGSAAFTVEKKVSPALTVDPKKISAKNFVNSKKGVKLAVKNLKAGTSVKFTVTPSGKGVTPYTYTATADKNGTAQWSVYGTSSSNPSVYVGKYSVKAAVSGGDTFKSAFQVTSGNANPGGGDDGGDGNGNGGGDGNGNLPKTGIELGGLGAGIVLLLVGGAALVIARRKRN